MLKEEEALTAEEAQEVGAMKEALADLLAAENAVGMEANKLAESDWTLLRFVLARQHDIVKAAEMFEQTVCWRVSGAGGGIGIEALWDRWRVNRTPEAALADQYFYGGLSGITKRGGCVMIEQLGRADLQGILRESDSPTMTIAAAATTTAAAAGATAGEKPAHITAGSAGASGALAVDRQGGLLPLILDAYTIHLERAFRQVRRAGGRTRAVVIVDLSGLGVSFIRNISVIRQIAQIGPAFYPEVTEGVYCIRAPWAASAAWKLISPLLPAATRAKVAILGSDFSPFLRERIDAPSLPPHLLDAQEEKAEASARVREAAGAAKIDPDGVVDDLEQRALPVPQNAISTLPAP